MTTVARALLAFFCSTLRSRTSMQIEILARPHKFTIFQQDRVRPRSPPRKQDASRVMWKLSGVTSA